MVLATKSAAAAWPVTTKKRGVSLKHHWLFSNQHTNRQALEESMICCYWWWSIRGINRTYSPRPLSYSFHFVKLESGQDEDLIDHAYVRNRDNGVPHPASPPIIAIWGSYEDKKAGKTVKRGKQEERRIIIEERLNSPRAVSHKRYSGSRKIVVGNGVNHGLGLDCCEKR